MKNNRPIIVCLFHVYSHPELWNVNSFKRSKTFKPNFTPRKACKLQQSWHILNKKGMLLNLSNWASLYTNLTRLVNNIFKKGLVFIFVFNQTFYPNFPTFSHRYICHIRDILQLCSYLACLTNCMLTVVTFVFLCNISFAIVPQPFS